MEQTVSERIRLYTKGVIVLSLSIICAMLLLSQSVSAATKATTGEFVPHYVTNASKVSSELNELSVFEYGGNAGRCVYNFSKEGYTGITEFGNTIFAETTYGFRLFTEDGGVVNYEIYNNIGKNNLIIDKARVFHVDDKSLEANVISGNIKNVCIGKSYTLRMDNADPGLYFIRAYVTEPNNTKGPSSNTVDGYFYIDENGNAYICNYQNNTSCVSLKRNICAFHMWTDSLDPDDYLSFDGVTYPTSGTNGRVVDVQNWINKSHEIANDDWSDGYKLWRWSEWLAYNVAYDDYKLSIGTSRAKAMGNYSDPNNFTYTNNTGVCWDYTNIITIMCRANGIPCTSMETDTHTWACAYVDGSWRTVDVVRYNRYCCNQKDTNKAKWVNDYVQESDYLTYGGFFNEMTEVVSINDQIWTRDIALGINK